MVAESLELWAGPECTVNRVGEGYCDQLVTTGHDARENDLALLSGLGIAAVRYPLLWERIAPEHPETRDWSWTDRRLETLRAMHIRPIAGLVHHGSGPRYTNLLADDFASGLAAHAAATAERYPWVSDWTPVNEPVTTARFSALYGHWYPHAKDERSYWLALLNQTDATRAAMAAVRRVNPTARLIQTDDLGRTFATGVMHEQAAFDNVRRWAGWDLLCGCVTRHHPLFARIAGYGFEDRLHAIAEAPCPPDMIGMNHYATSNRFLDHRVRRYPAETRGSNGLRAYADVEAVRVLNPPPPGFEGLLREAWARYRIPLALTEVHNGCTRDEQMRWTTEAWDSANRLRTEGVDVRAVTAWSLFGSHGWDRLLTGGGHYEPGAFDARAGTPRPTALVRLLQSLQSGAGERHPVLESGGWWTRPVRLLYPTACRAATLREHKRASDLAGRPTSPILIVGATGSLGQALSRACHHRAMTHVLTDRRTLDLTDPISIAEALDSNSPWTVINAAGWVRVDEAEDARDACFRANTDGALMLARACAERGIPCVSISSDLIFDGQADTPYLELDQPKPVNVYGASKTAMEHGLAEMSAANLVVRTAAFFSPFDTHNLAAHLAKSLAAGETFELADDQIVTPTYVPHLCDALLDLAIDGATGIHHLTNGEALSWVAFGRRLAAAMGYSPDVVQSRSGPDPARRAPRPAYVPLGSVHGAMLPSLGEAIACFTRDFRPPQANVRLEA